MIMKNNMQNIDLKAYLAFFEHVVDYSKSVDESVDSESVVESLKTIVKNVTECVVDDSASVVGNSENIMKQPERVINKGFFLTLVQYTRTGIQCVFSAF